MEYEQFEKECNKVLTVRLGLGIHDDEFVNATWRDYYNKGLSPTNAVNPVTQAMHNDTDEA